jgi:hypothetical protein
VTLLLVLNATLAVTGAGFGAVAVLRPHALVATLRSAPIDAATRYYAQMYGSRAIPLGAATAVACVAAARSDDVPLLPWLVVAGAAQLGDVLIGLRHRVTGMVVGASIAAIAHLGSAVLLA